MGYLAIARKWRPSRFDDLVGQGHVVQTLRNAILFQRVGHAYLFSGARGVGKTSVARIFAKALRCPNAQNAVACDQCSECLAIAESRSVDVVEIDGASNNGVEAVRGIRENVAYGASHGQYKIYIIDEVHMLSLSAFNALLKTLEEPPAHVLFILATTEAQKIPLTILSRCQRFEFRRLKNTQIAERLKHILQAENVAMDEEGLRTLASHSDGSLRDALSLLDQVLSYFGRPVPEEALALTSQQVVEALGINETSTVSAFLQAILKKDIPHILQRIGEVYLAGVDLKHFTERCLEELRLVYLVALAKEGSRPITSEELDISAAHFAALSELADGGAVLQIERMAQILGKTIQQLGWSSQPRFLLEMAAVRMGKLDRLSEIEAALLSREKIEAAPRTPPLERPAPELRAVPSPELRAVPSHEPRGRPSNPVEYPAPPPLPMSHAEMRGDDPQATWKAFVDSVMKKRPLLGALLCHANFKMETGDKGRQIILAFPEGSFYERQANDAKNRHEIEELLKLFFGRETSVQLSSSAANTIKSLEQVHQAEEALLKKNALENPTTLQVKEILGAEVVDVNVDI